MYYTGLKKTLPTHLGQVDFLSVRGTFYLTCPQVSHSSANRKNKSCPTKAKFESYLFKWQPEIHVFFVQALLLAQQFEIKHLLFSIPGAAKKVQPHVVTFWNNAKVEMLPPKLSEWPAIKKSFIGLKDAALKGKFLDITVKEATVNTLVAVEIAFWFYVGEVIGRRSLIGYNVWRTFKMYWLFQYFLTECVAKPFDVCVKKMGFVFLVSWPSK